MKSNKFLLFVLLSIVVFLAGCSATGKEAVFSANPVDDAATAAAALLASLYFIPAFIAGGLAIAEYYGLITQAVSDVAQIYANSALYIICFVLVVLGKTFVLSTIEHYLSGVHPLLVAVLAMLGLAIHSIAQTKHFSRTFHSLYPFQEKLKTLRE